LLKLADIGKNRYLCSRNSDKTLPAKDMEYLPVRRFAEKYGISERSVRNYCATGGIESAFLTAS